MNSKLPIIEQLQRAGDDRERAGILLRVPDAVLLKYETVFLQACRQFEAGELFVLQRVNAMRMVRSEVGALPGKIALELETLRAELAAYAAGVPIIPFQERYPNLLTLQMEATAAVAAAQGPPSIDI